MISLPDAIKYLYPTNTEDKKKAVEIMKQKGQRKTLCGIAGSYTIEWGYNMVIDVKEFLSKPYLYDEPLGCRGWQKRKKQVLSIILRVLIETYTDAYNNGYMWIWQFSIYGTKGNYNQSEGRGANLSSLSTRSFMILN